MVMIVVDAVVIDDTNGINGTVGMEWMAQLKWTAHVTIVLW